MDKVTEYFMEQSQKNTARLYDLAKTSVANSVEMMNWVQNEAQQITGRLTEKGAEQFVTQLERLQSQQIEAQQEFKSQVDVLVNLLQPKGE